MRSATAVATSNGRCWVRGRWARSASKKTRKAQEDNRKKRRQYEECNSAMLCQHRKEALFLLAAARAARRFGHPRSADASFGRVASTARRARSVVVRVQRARWVARKGAARIAEALLGALRSEGAPASCRFCHRLRILRVSLPRCCGCPLFFPFVCAASRFTAAWVQHCHHHLAHIAPAGFVWVRACIVVPFDHHQHPLPLNPPPRRLTPLLSFRRGGSSTAPTRLPRRPGTGPRSLSLHLPSPPFLLPGGAPHAGERSSASLRFSISVLRVLDVLCASARSRTRRCLVAARRRTCVGTPPATRLRIGV